MVAILEPQGAERRTLALEFSPTEAALAFLSERAAKHTPGQDPDRYIAGTLSCVANRHAEVLSKEAQPNSAVFMTAIVIRCRVSGEEFELGVVTLLATGVTKVCMPDEREALRASAKDAAKLRVIASALAAALAGPRQCEDCRGKS